MLINLFHRVAIEELVLKLASPLGVVEYVLDVLALFVLGYQALRDDELSFLYNENLVCWFSFLEEVRVFGT